MKFEYWLYQIHPQVFLLEIDNVYDLGMVFLRSQEYFESTNEAFNHRSFSLLEYMDWYAKTISENIAFSYGSDYFGFNLSSDVIAECYQVSEELTPYDKFMLKLFGVMAKAAKTDSFYIIGTRQNDKETLKHELAHAYFFADEQYRNEMTHLVNELPCKKEVFKMLSEEFSYGDNVHVDETQAFFATGVYDGLTKFKKYRPPFVKLFRKKNKRFTLPQPIKNETVDFFPKNNI